MNAAVIDLRENQEIADRLREAAALLEAQGANPYRAGAYRKAADTIARLPRPVRETFDAKGVTGLDALPHVGKGIAAAIAEILITGRWNQLERLRGTLDPVQLFQGVPGIGPQLAQRMHETLHVDTLEALETAAHDGRLEAVPGVGTRRAAAWRAVSIINTTAPSPGTSALPAANRPDMKWSVKIRSESSSTAPLRTASAWPARSAAIAGRAAEARPIFFLVTSRALRQ